MSQRKEKGEVLKINRDKYWFHKRLILSKLHNTKPTTSARTMTSKDITGSSTQYFLRLHPNKYSKKNFMSRNRNNVITIPITWDLHSGPLTNVITSILSAPEEPQNQRTKMYRNQQLRLKGRTNYYGKHREYVTVTLTMMKQTLKNITGMKPKWKISGRI